MTIAVLRQVGGSVMVAIPPAVLHQLSLAPRASLEIEVEDGRIVLAPASGRARHTLSQLLAECDTTAPPIAADPAWTDAAPVGGELV